MHDLSRSRIPPAYRAFSTRALPVIQMPPSISNLPELQITPVPEEVTSNQVIYTTASLTLKKALKSNKEEQAMLRLLKSLPTLDQYFVLHKKIGEGTYSSVYLASYKSSKSNKQFAVKHLSDNFSLSRVQKELRFMQIMGGHDNVVSVLNHFKSIDKECVVFVMPYMPHKRFSDYVHTMDSSELRLYMKNLFLALRRVHSFNVIHRDVKPGNFLYDRPTGSFLLVDFGLAQEVNETVREKGIKREGDGENVPINYSKRKRMSNDSGVYPKKMMTSSPLQSCENIMNRSFAGGQSFSLSPNASSPGQNFSFRSESANFASSDKSNLNVSGNSGASRREPSLGTSLLKSQTESRLASTPKYLSSLPEPKFTPLVGSNVPLESFVQVRNSQVVMQKHSLCECTSRPAICSQCAGKKTLAAPRAGTPGFRPPEVLLKYLHQTTAVDMWAAGVVLLCVLTGTYPFFKSPSDLAALMEIVTIFGTDAVQELAEKFGRKMPCSAYKPPMDLKKMCRRRRGRFANQNIPALGKCQFCLQNIRYDGCVCYSGPLSSSNVFTDGDLFPDSVYHLLSRLIDLDPESRITAEEALNHPFITQV